MTRQRPVLWAALSAIYASSAYGITISVDVSKNRRDISPMVYGMNFADATALDELNVPLNRQGGNSMTRYNWQQNADNRAHDWFFESIAYTSSTPGEAATTFVQTAKAAGAEAMQTVPCNGYVAKVGSNREVLYSYSTLKYGAQQSTDQWQPNAGNGVLANGTKITWNDKTDANIAVTPDFQTGYLNLMKSTFGSAANGGVKYYIMDNEPSLWHETHGDVFPQGATMNETFTKIAEYATLVRKADADAKIVAPEEWGWSGYLNSGYDLWYGGKYGWSNLPDRAANGGLDYVPWMLKQLKAREASTGIKMLDVFSLHIYPQSGEFGNDVSETVQKLRNRSTRSLWDTSYTDESWIASVVKLIPRMKEWVATYYPGLQTGITEYNWGAESHINGATAQADIFGIFGREGLDLATRWTTPAQGTPVYNSIKMYRNYDGKKSTFGDVSVSTGVPDADTVSAFSAVRSSDGALTIMVINKDLASASAASVSLANFAHAGVAQAWQLTSTNTISKLSDITVSGSSFSSTVPAQSITLFVLPASSTATTPTPATTTPTPAATPKPWTAAPGGHTPAPNTSLYAACSTSSTCYDSTTCYALRASLPFGMCLRQCNTDSWLCNVL